jgi:hypothetical protein
MPFLWSHTATSHPINHCPKPNADLPPQVRGCATCFFRPFFSPTRHPHTRGTTHQPFMGLVTRLLLRMLTTWLR